MDRHTLTSELTKSLVRVAFNDSWLRDEVATLEGLVTAYVIGTPVSGRLRSTQSDIDVGLVFETPAHITATLLARLAGIRSQADIPLEFAVMSRLHFPPPSSILRHRLRQESRLLYGEPYAHLVTVHDALAVRRECLIEISTLARTLRGLAIRGAWTVLPNFDDAISQFFKTIVAALRCLAVACDEPNLDEASLLDPNGAVTTRLPQMSQATVHYIAAAHWGMLDGPVWDGAGDPANLCEAALGVVVDIQALITGDPPIGASRNVHAMIAMDLQIETLEGASQIRLPALVIHRTGDRVCRIEPARWMARQNPDSHHLDAFGNDHFSVLAYQDTNAVASVLPDRVRARV